jgi:hypothetical protein
MDEKRPPKELFRDWKKQRGSDMGDYAGSSISSEQEAGYARQRNMQRGGTGKTWRTKEEKQNQRLRRKSDLLTTVTARLEMTPHQIRRAETIFIPLDSQKFGFSLELVAFCLCALVVRQDGRIYHPNCKDENNDELFTAYAGELNPRDRRMIHKVMTRLQRRYSNELPW